jgi:signal transduction histidine kinase
LALSKRIVEGHRGRIRVRSSLRPGKSGTIFKISLPV